MQRCIGKSGLYFSDEDAALACEHPATILPRFWMWSRDGNLDAWICSKHARIWREKYSSRYWKNYLTDQLCGALCRR